MIRALLIASVAAASLTAAEPKKLNILFLGDNGHHLPADRYRQLARALAPRGIEIAYADTAAVLNTKNLARYDGLVVFANIDTITPDQESALLSYVAEGKGFIPIHCASFCFRNSEEYVKLVGAQFQSHKTGVFRVSPVANDHPITDGYGGFESWDETYVHSKHNTKDRTVLEYRKEKDVNEPWTWVRTHGKGRVFYTAWGHDDRTWANSGFHNLIERGIRWACGSDVKVASAYVDQPTMKQPNPAARPFEFKDAKIPFYPAGARWGTLAEPINKMQLPMAPADSVRHMQFPADFEVKEFINESKLPGKPIAMNWDERGRLWLSVTLDYPNEMQPEGSGRDKIVVCEDTDGDGTADKVTVFADKLSIPTSLAFAYGGVVVHQAPHTLFLRDTDNDGVADQRTILFSGWGTNDTHAGPSNLRYGLDGWYYSMVGYSAFNGTVAGEQHRFGQGLLRFRLNQDEKGAVRAEKLEFLRSTSNNSWGVGISEEGFVFGSTANGCPSVHLAIPNRFYEKVRGWSSSVLPMIALNNKIEPIMENIRQVDWHGGFTAAAGHAVYTARAYPQTYWNRTAFVNEPTGHLTATFRLHDNGSDFVTRNTFNLVASRDEWTAPIMAEVGPDGNVWILDWYNFIVQHNPTPVGYRTGRGNAYESDLRDKRHGRIYRIAAKGAEFGKPLDATKGKELAERLNDSNMFWRLHAQRLLTEKGISLSDPAVRNVLLGHLKNTTVDAVGLNVAAIHALWTLRNGPGFDGDSIPTELQQAAFQHGSFGVRRSAALTLIPGLVKSGKNLNWAVALTTDPNLHVRLAALLATAESGADKTLAGAVAQAVRQPENLADRWIPDALTSAAASNDVEFFKSLGKGPLPKRTQTLVAVVAEHFARRGPNDAELAAMFAALTAADPGTSEIVLTAMAKGWPRGRTVALSETTDSALVTLVKASTPAMRAPLLRLASAMGSKAVDQFSGEIVAALTKTLESGDDSARVSAARQLIELRPNDVKVVSTALDLISPRTGPELAGGLIDAVGGSSAGELGAELTKRYSSWTPIARSAALRVLLGRADSAKSLMEALESGKIPLGELALDQKQALTTHPDPGIAKRAKAVLAKGGGLPSADRQKVIEELMPITKKDGDAVAGKLMFTKHCAACHQHQGEGTRIGPDLTGMAVHPKEELLVHIMDPSRSVEGNFRIYQITTTNNKVHNAMLASETKTSLELVDSQGKKTVVLREEIDTMTATAKSLMPEGFEKQMNPKEIGDLLSFLTKRGKFLPIPLDKSATIVSTKGMFHDEKSTVERLVLRDWKPRTVEGVPFVLIDPQGDKVPNVILLSGPEGKVSARMPRAVTVTVNSSAKIIHLLSGMSGWGYPALEKGTVSLRVTLLYADGKSETHSFKNGEHFADYIRRVDVPGSKFAFDAGGRQMRYLSLVPGRNEVIKQIEFSKGADRTAPIIAAVTIEGQ